MCQFLLILLNLQPPTGVHAHDRPNDAGSAIIIEWTLPPDDAQVEKYVVMRRTATDTAYEKIGSIRRGGDQFEDDNTNDSQEYVYQVAAVKDNESSCSSASNSARSYQQLFHFGRINVLAALVFFLSCIFFFILRSKAGRRLFIRKIPGLEAVDEAVGRATEMGRPILYVPGLADIDFPSTIASLNILGEVAKKIAQYDTPLIVCNRYSVAFTVSKEVVREAFVTQGKPDKYRDEYVRYLTEAQFGFAAAVNGIMLREKPATNFFIGAFWAESLIMAETGAQTGAIQIAGTDQVLQLPFFITACDYTLIGEEVYAASAYLSHEPLLMSSIKAQDIGKLAILVILFGLTALSFLRIDLTHWLVVQ